MSKNYKERLNKITTIIFDVDGVFTDNSLYLLEGQQPMRKMNVKDGYVVQLAARLDYKLAIISGGRSEAVRERFEGLGLQDIHLGAHNKMAVYEKFIATHGLKHEEILYMGDDIPDRGVMNLVGLACCPQDAASPIKEVSHYVSPYKGGHGCVRDVLEQLLRLHGHWLGEESATW